MKTITTLDQLEIILLCRRKLESEGYQILGTPRLDVEYSPAESGTDEPIHKVTFAVETQIVKAINDKPGKPKNDA